MSQKVNVIGLIFQSTHGEHYYSKYFTTHCKNTLARSLYQLGTVEQQRKFERALRDKVAAMNVISKMKPEQTEIFALGGLTVLFKLLNELQIYLVCDQEENYFVMESVLNCVGECLERNTKEWVGKTVYDNLDAIVTVTDEVLDEGIVVNMDANVVFGRMKMNQQLGDAPKKQDKAAPAAQAQPAAGGGAFSSFFGFAKNSLQKTLNLG